MKKQSILILFFACFSLTVFAQDKSNHVEPSEIAILPKDQLIFAFPENSKPAELTTKDLAEIENILIECINKYNQEQDKIASEDGTQLDNMDKRNHAIDLQRYKRQYLAITNSKGEKEVWINCFCDTWKDYKDWEKEVILAKGGGNCFFQMNVNLTTKKHKDFNINSDE